MRRKRTTPFHRRAWTPLLLAAAAAITAGTLPHARPANAEPNPGGWQPPPALDWPEKDPIVESDDVGYLPGGGQITAAGDYRYSLPIDVPDGRAGMQPRVSLNYSSRGGNGILGVGWSLDYGGSEITRCSKTFAIDGRTDTPNYTNSDALCLDGQRLIYTGNNGEYHTERDTFVKVIKQEAGSFEVFLPGGNIRTYTALTAKRILPPPVDPSPIVDPDPPLEDDFAVPVWVMTQERDRSGNAIVFNYQVEAETELPFNFEYRIQSIEYTARTDSVGNVVEPGLREIEFEYSSVAARPDQVFQYKEGVRHRVSRRLERIWLKAPDPIFKADVGFYALTYEDAPDQDRSFLEIVGRYDAWQHGLWTRRFEWEHPGLPQFTVHDVMAFDGYWNPDAADPQPFDADNDGKDELLAAGSFCRTLPGSSTPLDNCVMTNAAVAYNRPADVDGNGKVDVFAAAPNGGMAYGTWNEATQTFEPNGYPVPTFVTDLIDADGDGLIDAFAPGTPVSGEPPDELTEEWFFFRNNGQGFNPKVHFVPPAWFRANQPTIAVDLNGDGRGELHVKYHSYEEDPNTGEIEPFPSECYGPQADTWQYKALGTNDSANLSVKAAIPLRGCSGMLIDLNGDGLKDRANIYGGTVRYNAGTNFLPGEIFPTDIHKANGQERVEFADIDGDGREDVISSNEAASDDPQDALPSTYLHVRRGANFERVDLGVAPYNIPRFDQDDASPIVKPGDVNGDGLPDLVVMERHHATEALPAHTTLRVLVQDPHLNHVVRRVWDENGTEPRETVFYSNVPTDNPSLGSCSFPTRCMHHGMVTAREHWIHRHEEPAAIRRTAYDFDGAKMDLHGRGFLGFHTVHTRDLDSYAETFTISDNTTLDTNGRYPFAGLPWQVWRITPILHTSTDAVGGVVLPAPQTSITARVTHAVYTYESRLTNGDETYAVFPQETHIEEWEQHVEIGENGLTLLNDGSETAHRVRHTTQETDDFGNATHTEAWTIGGQRCETTSTYENDTPSWLIGQMLTNEVTCNKDGLPLPEARQTTMEYDASGLLEKVTIEPLHPELSVVTDYTRNIYGQVWKATLSAAGETTRQTFIAYDDENIHPRATCNALGHCNQQLVHPAFGVPVVGQDPNGVQVHYSYDGFGRVREIDPDDGVGLVVSYQEHPTEPWGLVVVEEREDNSDFQVRIDEWGRTLTTKHTGFGGEQINGRVRYNRFGQPTQQYRPAANQAPTLATVTTFDTLGRAVRVVEPNDAITVLAHTMFETVTTDAEGRQSRVTRDVDNRVAHTGNLYDGQWVETTYLYGSFSQVEQVVDPEGNVVHAFYDKLGRRVVQDDPDRGITGWTHNAFGEITTETDALGDTTSFERDLLGRVTWMHHDDNGTTTFDYDGNGDPGERGRLTSASSPDGVTTTYQYDAMGRNTKTSWQLGTSLYDIEREYGEFGRLDKIKYPVAPGHPRFTAKYHYNAYGYTDQVLDVSNPNLPKPLWVLASRSVDGLPGESWTANGLTETRQYDPATGRFTNIEAVNDNSGQALYAIQYAHDLTGNITSRVDYALSSSARAETFHYDALDRLKRWTVDFDHQADETLYTYDLLGNIETVTSSVGTEVHAHDGQLQNGLLKLPHALTSRTMGAQSTSFHYDARGRQDTGAGREISWKPFDLPSSIHQNSQTTTFSYDAFGTRIRKVRAVSGSGSLIDATDTLAGLYERRWSASSPTQHIFYVHGTDGPVAQIVYTDVEGDTGEALYLHTEAHGSIGLITDKDGGEVQRTYFDPHGAKTDAYGQPTSPMLGSVKLGFTGHRHDDELGLVDMKGRIYDPAQKRFLSPDPHVTHPLFGQSYNRFAYVLNNPLRYTDPTGFDQNQGASRPGTGASIENGGALIVFADQPCSGERPAVQSSTAKGNQPATGATADQPPPDPNKAKDNLQRDADIKLQRVAAANWYGQSDTHVAWRNEGAHNLQRGADGATALNLAGDAAEWAAVAVLSISGPGGRTAAVVLASGGFEMVEGYVTGNMQQAGDGAKQVLKNVAIKAATELVCEALGAAMRPAGPDGSDGDIPVQDDPSEGPAELPSLDSTDKVHGQLPTPESLDEYSADELKDLRDQLRASVQERIRRTVQLGRDRPHGQRQGQEQQLIRQIDKRLEDR